VAGEPAVEEATVVAGICGVVVVVVVLDEAAVPPHPGTNETTSAITIAPRRKGGT
jgi:hypothetical protein